MPVAAVSQKATPDLGKLAGMTKRTVQVSKHMSKTGAGQIIITPTPNITVDNITDLMKQIPIYYGAGTYTFEVFDEGGTEKDVWVTKLGGDVQEVSMGQGSPFNFGPPPTFAGGAPSHTGPAPEGSIALGNGYFYNQDLGLLSAPGRPPVPWRPGEPVPTLFGAASAQPTASALPPWMTPPGVPQGPWGASPWPSPGWGAMPATTSSNESTQIDTLKAQLADAETRRREDLHKTELNEMRAGFTRALDDMNKRFEMLVSKLGEKPGGPSPEVAALQAELMTMKSSTESQAREDRIRGEMQAQRQQFETLLREVTSKQGDPMMSFLGQIMQSFQASQSNTVQAMRDATASTTEKLSGSVMGPMQMMQMMQMLRDNPADKAQQELFTTIFTMMQGLLKMQNEMSADSTPPWVGIAHAGMESIGSIAQALMQRQPQVAAPQSQYIPPQQQRQPQVAQQPRRAQVATQQTSAVAADPRAAAATQVFGVNTPGDQARASAAATTGLYAGAAAAPSTSAGGVPPAVNGVPTTPEGIAASMTTPPSHNGITVAPADVIPPPAKRRRKAAPIEVVQQVPTIAGVSPEAIKEILTTIPDPEFFGPIMQHVINLRADVAAGKLSPQQVVDLLVQAPAGLQAFGAFPPVLELYNTGHFDLLIDRLLPQSPPEYRAEVTNLLIARTDEGGDEGDEEEDGDEEADGDADERGAA